MGNYSLRMAKQLMLIAERLLEAGKKERFDEYTSILMENKFDEDEISEILEKLDGLKPANKERIALHWIMNDTLELPKDAEKLDEAFDYLEKYKKRVEIFDDPDEVIDFGQRRDTERTVVDDFEPDECHDFSNKQNLGNGIVVYDVDDTWDGMMAVRAAMDASWGYNGGSWSLATRYQGEMEKAWSYWKRYDAYPKRIAFKNGELYMFCANGEKRLIWWDKNGNDYCYLPGAFDKRGYELTGSYKGMAINPETSPEELMMLAEIEDKTVRREVAMNSNTPSEALKRLAADEDEYVRCRVANNTNTPIGTLRKLVNDEKSGVRYHVANNPSTPAGTLKMLVNDENDDVRCRVANNLNTPSGTLKMLANDENDDVRYCVAYNPNTPSETLKMLVEDEDRRVRHKAAQNLYARA